MGGKEGLVLKLAFLTLPVLDQRMGGEGGLELQLASLPLPNVSVLRW